MHATAAGETAVRRALARLSERIASAAEALILPALSRERAAVGIRDAAGDDVRNSLASLRNRAAVEAQEAAEEIADEIRAEAARHQRRWVATINAGVGIDISALLQADDVAAILEVRAAAVAALIESVSADIQSRVAQAALSGIYGGSTDSVAKAIREALGVAQRRARLIARDQMAKLNSDLNEYRQREIGVKKYRWKTLLDGRERDHHRERNNDVFRWDAPPPGGHPGREINCRCRALAIITLPGEDGGDT